MQSGIRTLFLLSLLVLSANLALADITITTDQATYLPGDIVQITVENTGPFNTYFNSDPILSVINVDTMECFWGCIGLAVITDFPMGTTVTRSHDTASIPYPNGNYRVYPNITGLTIYAEFTVTGEVATEAVSWGQIKALYRN